MKQPFSGVIRKENVLASETDRIGMEQCCRPGDIVVAEVRAAVPLSRCRPCARWRTWVCAPPLSVTQVVSLGDSKSYFLSTAKPEHGVVFAKSEAGAVMVPISYHQMQCPVSKVVVDRKVARVNFDSVAP